MSWTDRVVGVLMVCLIITVTVMCAICVYYVPSLLSAHIACERAKAKALSGLDLRDEETRRAIRELLGGEALDR